MDGLGHYIEKIQPKSSVSGDTSVSDDRRKQWLTNIYIYVCVYICILYVHIYNVCIYIYINIYMIGIVPGFNLKV
jgi:hypothetical protein